MFKCTIWLDAACLSSTLCESEAISESNLRPPLIWYVESHESDQSTRKTEGSLTPKAHANAASVITYQLSLKGKAADVAKHLNITHDVRDAENAGGIAECSHTMEFTL